MNPLTISFIADTESNYQPSSTYNLFLPGVVNNTNNLTAPDATFSALKDSSIQFASALTHEVRNPLTNINLAVEMLSRLVSDDAPKIYLDIIKRGSIRINDLISELLKFKPADNGSIKEYSIHQLLDEVIEMADDRMRLKNIVVTKDFSIWDIKIILNKPEMKIALTNIIINAIDAMGPEKGELKLTTKSSGNKYIIQIKDNGCGISKKNLKNIFKPYFTDKPGGLGLGLAKTYNILHANQVGINVESEAGKGTCFILSFNKNNQDDRFQSIKN
jgi:signal transduction histidine kinase